MEAAPPRDCRGWSLLAVLLVFLTGLGGFVAWDLAPVWMSDDSHYRRFEAIKQSGRKWPAVREEFEQAGFVIRQDDPSTDPSEMGMAVVELRTPWLVRVFQRLFPNASWSWTPHRGGLWYTHTGEVMRHLAF